MTHAYTYFVVVVFFSFFIYEMATRRPKKVAEPTWMTFSRCAVKAETLAKDWDRIGEDELRDIHRDLSGTYQMWADVFGGLDPVLADRRRKTGNCVKCGAIATWLDLGYDPSLCTRCGQENHREHQNGLPAGAPEGYEQFKRRFIADQQLRMRNLPDTWTSRARAERRAEIQRAIDDIKTGGHTDRHSVQGSPLCYCLQCWESRKLWQFWGPDSWHSRRDRARTLGITESEISMHGVDGALAKLKEANRA